MKKLLFGLFLIFININLAYALDTSLKIYDNADVLNDSEESSLKELIDGYINEYNMDMVLVTENSHNKKSTKEYAQDFYDYNGFGIGKTKDGVIFVIDFTFGYTDIYMVTTGQAILVYDDGRINNILDNVALKKDDGYFSMFEEFLDGSSMYASYGIPDSNKNAYIDENGDYRIKRSIFEYIIRAIIPSAIVATVVLLIFIFKNKMVRKSTDAAYYLKAGSVIINTKSDKFFSTHTTSHKISTESSSSGGSGGSSISRGSSGISHGGGGRRL